MKLIMSIKAMRPTEKGRNRIIRIERERNFPSLFLLLWCTEKESAGDCDATLLGDSCPFITNVLTT